ncbi:MAG: 26S protease regulatory subunit [Salinigranum sp.]
MTPQPFDVYDDALYDCADGAVRFGSEVVERLPEASVAPLECLGRVRFGWRTDGDDPAREYVTDAGVLVSGGRVCDRETGAKLSFETALTAEAVEASLEETVDDGLDGVGDEGHGEVADGRGEAADDHGVGDDGHGEAYDGDVDVARLRELRARVARIASGVVDMAAKRRFFERAEESVPIGVDRRYEIRIDDGMRERVAGALERAVGPAEARFVAGTLPRTIEARVELAPTGSGDGRPDSENGSTNDGLAGGGGAADAGESGEDDGEAGDDGPGADANPSPPTSAEDAEYWLSPPPTLTFADVGGMDDLKDDLREKVINPLCEPAVYERYGLGASNGILLYGPPGTGKTYVTKALAGELGYSFVNVDPADIASKWVGEAAKQVSRVFEIARENQPCLVFIDELDAIAPRRDGGTHSTQSERQMLNQLLIELAEVQGERIVVVAATNKYDEVDDAIRRSGRFDERIEVPPPDGPSRVEILCTHLADRPFDRESLDREHVAERTRGYTASDMELVATNAAREALERERATDRRARICQNDVEAAIAETEPSLPTADLETWRWATCR